MVDVRANHIDRGATAVSEFKRVWSVKSKPAHVLLTLFPSALHSVLCHATNPSVVLVSLIKLRIISADPWRSLITLMSPLNSAWRPWKNALISCVSSLPTPRRILFSTTTRTRHGTPLAHNQPLNPQIYSPRSLPTTPEDLTLVDSS
jgi:hypothetical protein